MKYSVLLFLKKETKAKNIQALIMYVVSYLYSYFYCSKFEFLFENDINNDTEICNSYKQYILYPNNYFYKHSKYNQ